MLQSGQTLRSASGSSRARASHQTSLSETRHQPAGACLQPSSLLLAISRSASQTSVSSSTRRCAAIGLVQYGLKTARALLQHRRARSSCRTTHPLLRRPTGPSARSRSTSRTVRLARRLWRQRRRRARSPPLLLLPRQQSLPPPQQR
jgi:hypothetical protein